MRRCVTRRHPSEDRISLLPDEILISILALLPFKEAARTSVLSKRWIGVWTYVSVLDLDASTALYKITKSRSHGLADNFRILLKRERGYFVRWMNKVLQSHKALALNEFRVYCDLDGSYKAEIDRWLQYAFARSIHRLELNLSRYNPASNSNYIYPFSREALGTRSLQSSEIKSQVSLQSLKILILKRVNVSEKYLIFFLHNCKFLERLVVHGSQELKNLEVHGPDLALQHLDLSCCYQLKSLVLHNVNLISLKVDHPYKLVLKDVPRLVDICLSSYKYNLKYVISRLSCHLSKLEVLSLHFPVGQYKKVAEFLPQFVLLKQLTQAVPVYSHEETILGLIDFVRASPNLEKFVLKIYGVRNLSWGRKLGSAVKYPHHHLKVVELHGCCGNANELELILYFLENAVSLEKIIINTRSQCSVEVPWLFQRPIAEVEERYRRHLEEKLEELIPSQMAKVHIGIYK